MESIKLKSGSEVLIESLDQPSEDTLRFTAIGISDYKSFSGILNRAELSEIKAYTGETLVGDYGSVPIVVYPIGVEEQEDGTVKATVTLRRENAIEARITALEDAVGKLIQTELGVL